MPVWHALLSSLMRGLPPAPVTSRVHGRPGHGADMLRVPRVPVGRGGGLVRVRELVAGESKNIFSISVPQNSVVFDDRFQQSLGRYSPQTEDFRDGEAPLSRAPWQWLYERGVPARTVAREAAAARLRCLGRRVAGRVHLCVSTAQGSAGSQVCVPVSVTET